MSTQFLMGEIQVSGDGASFVHALFVAGAMDADNIRYFLDKPWKWDTEYAAWRDAGKPTARDEAGWEKFEAALDQ